MAADGSIILKTEIDESGLKSGLSSLKSGIGKVCSAVGATELMGRYRPAAVLNTGVAGGIDTQLDVMDVVVGERIVYHDVWCGEGNEYGQVQGFPAVFTSDERLCEIALGVSCEGKVHKGLICSGDQFISDQKALGEIKKRFPMGLAVDMESCSIAQVCYLYKIPFLSYRMISDTPGVEHHAAQYRHFWEEVSQRSFGMLRNMLQQML